MGDNLLKQYEDGELTEEEVVNNLFMPWEQIDKSQFPLLGQMMHVASGGVAIPHVALVPVVPTTNPPGTATNTTPPAAKEKINSII